MKLVWCPETAGKAYIDAIELLTTSPSSNSTANAEAAELVAAMAGGWQSQCIVEAPLLQVSTDASTSSSKQLSTSTSFSISIALAAAARRTGGRHVCLVADEKERDYYLQGMCKAAGPTAAKAVEFVTGEVSTMVEKIQGVDFAFVSCLRGDASRVLTSLRPGHRGAVVVCKEAARMTRSCSGRKDWKGVFMPGARVVRASMLPLGHMGVEVVHVGVGKGPSLWDDVGDQKRGSGRWIKNVDPITGEEHLFRRQ